MMSDVMFYPECPVCATVDECGIDVSQTRVGMFLFECDECDTRSEGFYTPELSKVKWTNIDVSFWKWWLVLKPTYW